MPAAKRARLLWIGDAGCDSGFASSTHNVLAGVLDRYEPHVLGLNYRGGPHPFPYDIWPATQGYDPTGVSALKDLFVKVMPDVVVVQSDPWMIPRYMEVLQWAPGTPKVGIIAVNGENCQGGDASAERVPDRGLNALDHCVFWTKFGAEQARLGGYEGPSTVIPLGVDTSIYRADVSRAEARQHVTAGRITPSDFLVVNVNRNQQRKRMDLTLRYFANWVKDYKHAAHRAFLILHAAPTGESSYDLKQLGAYYGIKDRVLLSTTEAFKGISEKDMALLYRAADVNVSTGEGEGFGLGALQGMACGTPFIGGDYAAYGELHKGVATLVPCSTTHAEGKPSNVIGRVPDEAPFLGALEAHYQGKAGQDEVALIRHAKTFNWQTIGRDFAGLLDLVRKRFQPAPFDAERAEALIREEQAADEAKEIARFRGEQEPLLEVIP